VKQYREKTQMPEIIFCFLQGREKVKRKNVLRACIAAPLFLKKRSQTKTGRQHACLIGKMRNFRACMRSGSAFRATAPVSFFERKKYLKRFLYQGNP
jgi:hypothetical protein